MAKDVIWRVAWHLQAQPQTKCSIECSTEEKARQWAEVLAKNGAGKVTMTELIVGRVVEFSNFTEVAGCR